MTAGPRRRADRVLMTSITMKALSQMAQNVLILALCSTAFGCSELRARQLAREGNRLFHDGHYADAVAAFTAAEQLHPLPVIAFNKGLACRQLMVPGAKTAETERAVACALDAFTRLKRLRPSDARADQLYQQTLFDADRFETLAQLYQERLRLNPNDPVALGSLIQVYQRAGRWDEALRWTIERAKRQAGDAEAQYAVGVLIYVRLFEKGGGADKSSFDPRASSAKSERPPTVAGDIVDGERALLAEQGIEFLKKALELRPTYSDAMVYLGLLYRQKSFAFFDDPAAWQAAVDSAETYRKLATASHQEHAPQRP